MKDPEERTRKVTHLRTLARGYEVLKRDKASTYEAAAEVLELAEEHSARDKKSRH